MKNRMGASPFAELLTFVLALFLLVTFAGCDEESNPSGSTDDGPDYSAVGMPYFPIAVGNSWRWDEISGLETYVVNEVVSRETHLGQNAWRVQITGETGPGEYGYLAVINDTLFTTDSTDSEWVLAQPYVWIDGSEVGDTWVIEDDDSTGSWVEFVDDNAVVTVEGVSFNGCVETHEIALNITETSYDSLIIKDYYKPGTGLVYGVLEYWTDYMDTEVYKFFEIELALTEYTVQ